MYNIHYVVACKVSCLVCTRHVRLIHAVFQLTPPHLLPVLHESPYAGKAFKVSLKAQTLIRMRGLNYKNACNDDGQIH